MRPNAANDAIQKAYQRSAKIDAGHAEAVIKRSLRSARSLPKRRRGIRADRNAIVPAIPNGAIVLDSLDRRRPRQHFGLRLGVGLLKQQRLNHLVDAGDRRADGRRQTHGAMACQAVK